MNLLKNDVSLSLSKDVIDICSPLIVLHIDFFCYTRFYFDGSSFSLLTNTDWYQYFLQQEVPECVNVYNLNSGYFLWKDIFPAKPVIDAENIFNIRNAFSLNYKKQDHMEILTFASSKNKINFEYFLANMELLKKFKLYFKDKAKCLINKATNKQIIIPQVMRGYKPYNKENFLSFAEKMKYLNLIKQTDFTANLSNREYECLQYLSQGMTTKEIAKLLHISPRTVETHINKIKNKFDCVNKFQLVKKYWTFDYKH